MSVVTAVTAQNTREVRAVHEVPAAMVAAQIDAVLEDIGADAIKIGMLSSAGIIRAVADRLRVHLHGTGVPVVLDPVMIAKSGARLLREDAVEAPGGGAPAARHRGDPQPPRARGARPASPCGRRGAAAGRPGAWPARARRARQGRARAKGRRSSTCCWKAVAVHRFAHPRLPTASTHGTGCTLSAAIAARLGAGEELPRAVEGAIAYLAGAIAAAYP